MYSLISHTTCIYAQSLQDIIRFCLATVTVVIVRPSRSAYSFRQIGLLTSPYWRRSLYNSNLIFVFIKPWDTSYNLDPVPWKPRLDVTQVPVLSQWHYHRNLGSFSRALGSFIQNDTFTASSAFTFLRGICSRDQPRITRCFVLPPA